MPVPFIHADHPLRLLSYSVFSFLFRWKSSYVSFIIPYTIALLTFRFMSINRPFALLLMLGLTKPTRGLPRYFSISVRLYCILSRSCTHICLILCASSRHFNYFIARQATVFSQGSGYNNFFYMDWFWLPCIQSRTSQIVSHFFFLLLGVVATHKAFV
jgi:hypothetical protein